MNLKLVFQAIAVTADLATAPSGGAAGQEGHGRVNEART